MNSSDLRRLLTLRDELRRDIARASKTRRLTILGDALVMPTKLEHGSAAALIVLLDRFFPYGTTEQEAVEDAADTLATLKDAIEMEGAA